jgi:hypothetical protein
MARVGSTDKIRDATNMSEIVDVMIDKCNELDKSFNFGKYWGFVEKLEPSIPKFRQHEINDDVFQKWSHRLKQGAINYIKFQKTKDENLYNRAAAELVDKHSRGEHSLRAENFPIRPRTKSKEVEDSSVFPHESELKGVRLPIPPRRRPSIEPTPECSPGECVASGFRHLKTRGTRGRGSALTHHLKLNRM